MWAGEKETKLGLLGFVCDIFCWELYLHFNALFSQDQLLDLRFLWYIEISIFGSISKQFTYWASHILTTRWDSSRVSYDVLKKDHLIRKVCVCVCVCVLSFEKWGTFGRYLQKKSKMSHKNQLVYTFSSRCFYREGGTPKWKWESLGSMEPRQ